MHSEFTLNNHKESIKTDTQMHTIYKAPFETTQLSSDLKSLNLRFLSEYLDFCVTVFFVFRQWGLR